MLLNILFRIDFIKFGLLSLLDTHLLKCSHKQFSLVLETNNSLKCVYTIYTQFSVLMC